jgi:hypothetical protein
MRINNHANANGVICTTRTRTPIDHTLENFMFLLSLLLKIYHVLTLTLPHEKKIYEVSKLGNTPFLVM